MIGNSYPKSSPNSPTSHFMRSSIHAFAAGSTGHVGRNQPNMASDSTSGTLSLTRRLPAEQIEHGHPHGQAVGYLLQDGGVGAVGDFRRQLDAAVDRAGRQEKDVRLGAIEAVAVHAE